MPGLRRLRDVGSKISGALGAPRAEGSPDEPPAPPEPQVSGQTSGVQAPEQGSSAEMSQTGPDVEAAAPTPPEPEPAPAASAETTPAGEPDAVCAAAVDLARAAALEVGGDAVGEHVGVEAEAGTDGDLVVTHSFAATQAGYVGWRWAVTVARVPESEHVTVDEVVLLPGPGALVAPEWVPWADRVQPGDLGPGDLLPPPEHDPRLVPSHEDVQADRLPFDLHRELGQGRARVLSEFGRGVAAERWFDGEGGPGSARARQAPAPCFECGFFVRLAGDLGRMFGVCANGVAPDDGRVVALTHGCGAHSETVTTAAHASTTELVVEHEELELVDVASLPDPPSAEG